MKRLLVVCTVIIIALGSYARNVTVKAIDKSAESVFRSVVSQAEMNYIYSPGVFGNKKVTVNVTNKPLKKVLALIFKDTDIDYKIKGKSVVLKRKKKKAKVRQAVSYPLPVSIHVDTLVPKMLDEVVIISRLDLPQVSTAEMGAMKVTPDYIRNIPAMFGESDVIKSLHTQPGVTEGTEGLAGMHVHGGNTDENMYMLDNVPLYQVNHSAGMFSAFNTEAIRYIDFFKSSVPARYDGRLSSFMDVRSANGSMYGHHGSARLGLTSGAFNIGGPIGKKTSYMFALRRSWFDLLTVPMLAIVNSASDDEKIRLCYYFTDLNAKVSYRFSERVGGFASIYFGNDMIQSGSDNTASESYGTVEDDKYKFHWGNLMAQVGVNWRLKPSMSAEFTAAYTRYFSDMKHDDYIKEKYSDFEAVSHMVMNTDNNINDWILRADFDWNHSDNSKAGFGASATLHSFLPARTTRQYDYLGTQISSRDSTWAYRASEVNAYIEDEWRPCPSFVANVGLHASMFAIDGKTRFGIAPRLSLSYRIAEHWAVKAAFSRTNQYVHQLSQTYLALPTDQWVPVTGTFKPQSANKVAIGLYWQSPGEDYVASIEGYYKHMNNLIEYRDEYYLLPPLEMWNARLTSGKGTSKGLDFKIGKNTGKWTGHIAYSLAWADRIFPEKNFGKTYPARFDNRHTVNIVLNWMLNDRVQLNASWTGHSGNRYTLMPQVWEGPDFDSRYNGDVVPLVAPINNYRLPFYHRLDLSCTLRNRRGYWTFSLYNAYCHLNTIAIRRDYNKEGQPVFQKVKLLPVIPSISYTWKF